MEELIHQLKFTVKRALKKKKGAVEAKRLPCIWILHVGKTAPKGDISEILKHFPQDHVVVFYQGKTPKVPHIGFRLKNSTILAHFQRLTSPST